MSLALSPQKHIDSMIVDKDWVKTRCTDNFHLKKYRSHKYYSFSDSLIDLDMHFLHQNLDDMGNSFNY